MSWHGKARNVALVWGRQEPVENRITIFCNAADQLLFTEWKLGRWRNILLNIIMMIYRTQYALWHTPFLKKILALDDPKLMQQIFIWGWPVHDILATSLQTTIVFWSTIMRVVFKNMWSGGTVMMTVCQRDKRLADPSRTESIQSKNPCH